MTTRERVMAALAGREVNRVHSPSGTTSVPGVEIFEPYIVRMSSCPQRLRGQNGVSWTVNFVACRHENDPNSTNFVAAATKFLPATADPRPVFGPLFNNRRRRLPRRDPDTRSSVAAYRRRRCAQICYERISILRGERSQRSVGRTQAKRFRFVSERSSRRPLNRQGLQRGFGGWLISEIH